MIFVLQIAFAVGVTAYISYRNGQKTVTHMVSLLYDETITRISQHLDDYLDVPLKITRMSMNNARMGNLHLDNGDWLIRYFWELGQLYPGYGTFAFANKDGEFYGANEPERYLVMASRKMTGGAIRRFEVGPKGSRGAVLRDVPAYDARKRDWYKAAFSAGKPIWTDISLSVTGARLDLSAVTPYYDDGGIFQGIFLVDVSLSRINDFLGKLQIGGSGKVFIVDRKGFLIASSTGENPGKIAPGGKDPERVKAVDSNEQLIARAARRMAELPGGFAGLSSTGQELMKAGNGGEFLQITPYKSSNGLDWLIAMVIPEADFMEHINAANRLTALLCLIALAVAVSVGVFTARWIARPILRLNESAKALAQGHWDRVLTVDRSDELGELAGSFNTMTEQLKLSIETMEHEIDERRQAEAALMKSEEKYRTLFEESRDAVSLSTPSGKFIDINPAGIELFGYDSKEGILSANLTDDLYVEPAERDTFLSILDSQGYVNDFETRMRRKDGNELIVSVTATVVRDDSGKMTAIRGIIRDVTEHRRLEQQLRHSQKMEAVGQLAGGLAHDFNNILTAVMGYANLLEMRMEKSDPRLYNVQQILAAAEKASSLTKGLLTFSRKQVVNLKAVGINEVVRDMEPLMRRLIREDIDLKLRLSDEDTTVFADAMQIEQVLMNLAANARDAMPEGGLLLIETEAVLLDAVQARLYHGIKPGYYVQLSVTDTGTGIPEEIRNNIFDPFFTTKPKGKGTGLGLAIVYGIIAQHRGVIKVYSEPGRGTSFKIFLPAVEGEARKANYAEQQNPEGGNETILIAEDDATVRMITREILEQYGYTVITAEDGETAVERFRENADAIDLLLLDLIMPKKNGREVYNEVCAMKPGAKVVFYSGYTSDLIQKEEVFENGLNFLMKPASSRDLARKVREVLDKG